MEPQNGNSSDKATFHETIQRVRDFKQALAEETSDFIWVADSALYSKNKLLASNTYHWVSRVPESITQAKALLAQPAASLHWHELTHGYRYSRHESTYGDSKQRWLLIESAQAYAREKKTFDNKLKQQDEAIEKAYWHLGNEVFACECDARHAHEKCAQTLSLPPGGMHH